MQASHRQGNVMAAKPGLKTAGCRALKSSVTNPIPGLGVWLKL